MVSKTALLALLAAVAQAAVPQGFNYGALKPDNSPFSQQEYESMFKTAQNLPGTSGFTSARLYTMLQGQNVIAAIPAAISTKTQLLLGMWISGEGSPVDTEINALQQAIKQYGDNLKNLVVGISVGSEDIYRETPLGKSNPNAGAGLHGSDVAAAIKKVKDAIANGPLSGVPVGHVDTWTAWTDGDAKDAIAAADFLGVDAYPYWQNTVPNSIENGKSLFNTAIGNVQGASQGKPIWITEAGWPVKGSKYGDAVASTDNAKTFWQQVGCANFGKTPTFWYTLEELPTGDNPDFSIFNAQSNQPYFDLSCSNVQNSTNGGSMTSTGSASMSTSTGTSSYGSGASNGTYSGSGSPSQPGTGSGSGSSGSGSSGSGSGSGSSGSGSTSGSSGSGSSGSGSGSSSGSSSGSATGSAASGIQTAGAASMGVFSVGSLVAIAAAVAALL